MINNRQIAKRLSEWRFLCYNYIDWKGKTSMRKVRISTEYITLGQLLKMTDFISAGGEAKYFLMEADVFVNQEKENRRGKKLYPGDEVIIDDVSLLIVQ